MSAAQLTERSVRQVGSVLGLPEFLCTPPGPRIFIAGHQLTGKSTVAALLAGRLGLPRLSGGAMVRRMAADAGVSVEEMSRRLANDPDADAAVDRALLGAASAQPAVVESRLAGWLGGVFEQVTGLQAHRVLLRCDDGERAHRWVGRELGEGAGRLARRRAAVSGTGPPATSLPGALKRTVARLPPELRPDAGVLLDAGQRDSADRLRLRALYGVDYDNAQAFSMVIDVTRLRPEEVVEDILSMAQLKGSAGPTPPKTRPELSLGPRLAADRLRW
jgi:cytidylate kinase